MRRRTWLTLLAAGTVAALTGGGAADADPLPDPSTRFPRGVPAPPPNLRQSPPLPQAATLLPPPPPGPKTRLAPGTITKLPGTGTNLALTVDDGADADVVGAYIKFAQDTGARFTFFVTAAYPSWTTHRDALRPLVDSGQIQLGNHTWNHPALTRLSAAGVADQLSRTKTFLRNTFGVDGTPFYRPPYGYHDALVDRVAADQGYTVPTMWYGSLSDSSIITPEYLVKMAGQYFNPQAIVIGHANHPAVMQCYSQMTDIIKQRNLSMVTLNDVTLPPLDSAHQ
ncbi:polysaccharide deacetylase family protein [Nocardia sp. NEAU-G5]|uniref:Polysaccharide deacetylase family protein n=2 Tax=Nocardia albiluteola TaxID=2842303 RepID=A0ABS6B7Z0_9NOCA|nr:polysaccharide deacetylase family protein [Nocardia albiluteola]